jgi:hypothetical protein
MTESSDSKGGRKGNAKSVVEGMEVAYAAELPPVLLTIDM